MVDAIDLESISLAGECGFESRRPQYFEPFSIYVMAKKKVTPKQKPGPKPETLKIEGDWEDAVKTAITRGKPPKPKEQDNGQEREDQ